MNCNTTHYRANSSSVPGDPTDDIDEVLVDSKDAYKEAKDFFSETMPKCEKLVKLHKEKRPIFSRFQLEEQIDQIYEKRVSLPSGGYLIIEPTEALVSVDVNSGKSSGERGVEDTAFKTNMEAAEEVARQLRLRDLGGLIVIDFIDMRDRKHNHDVEHALKQALKMDKARVNIGRISEFGMLEMSRQRIAKTLNDAIHLECPHCEGRGKVKSVEAMAVSFLRKVHGAAAKGTVAEVRGGLPLEVAYYLLNRKKRELTEIENDYEIEVTVKGKTSFLLNQVELETIKREVPRAEDVARSEAEAGEAPAPVPRFDGGAAAAAEGGVSADGGKKRKRRRKKKKSGAEHGEDQQQVMVSGAPVEIEESEAHEESALEAATTEGAEEGDGKAKKRRRRKKKSGVHGAAAPEQAEHVAELPESVTSEAGEPAPEAEGEAHAKSKKRKRRRGKKGAKPVEATAGEGTIASVTAPSVEPVVTPAAPIVEPPVAEKPKAARPARSRKKPTAEVDVASPAPAAAPAPVADLPAVTAAEEAKVAPKKPRRAAAKKKEAAAAPPVPEAVAAEAKPAKAPAKPKKPAAKKKSASEPAAAAPEVTPAAKATKAKPAPKVRRTKKATEEA